MPRRSSSSPASRASLNLGVAETLQLDASQSFDPEGGALTFTWSVTPAQNVALVDSGADASASFSLPGLYEFTVTATDPQNNSASVTREVAVYNIADFSTFGDPVLPPTYALENLEIRDNYSPSTWISLEDRPGNLILQVQDDSAKPLSFASPTFPTIRRPLPVDGDFSLHTDLELITRQFGDFHTGLTVQLIESGQVRHYYFGIEDGDKLVAKRNASASTTTYASMAWDSKRAKIRIRRIGPALHFDYRVDDVWTTLHSEAIPLNSTAVDGGLFTYTGSAQSVGTEFDFLLLVDPNTSSDTLESLRITELMYHPIAGGSLEFIELINTGGTAIELENAGFDDGRPFGAFLFPAISLPAGSYGVVVADSAAFSAEDRRRDQHPRRVVGRGAQ